jgi:hypothetical protein
MADFNINLTAQPIALRTGAAIAFDRPAVYNTAATPSDATVTLDLTGAVPGTEVVAYFDHATVPTWPSGIFAVGVWTNGGLNVVRFVYISDTAISAVIGSDYNVGNAGVWRSVVKNANEDRFSTTTPAADTELRFPVAANKRYIVKGWIYGAFQSSAGVKYNISIPTGAVGWRYAPIHATEAGTAPVNTPQQAKGSDMSYTHTSTVGIVSLKFDFRFTNGVNNGEWTFDWSQVNSSASNYARINMASWIEYYEQP